MEILTVFVGAMAGVMLGSAAIEAIKKAKIKKELEETSNKARQLLADLAGDVKEAVEPKNEKDKEDEVH